MSGLVDADRYLARAIYMPLSVPLIVKRGQPVLADGLSPERSALSGCLFQAPNFAKGWTFSPVV